MINPDDILIPYIKPKKLAQMQAELDRLGCESIHEVILKHYVQGSKAMNDLSGMLNVYPGTIQKCMQAFGIASKPMTRTMRKFWQWPDHTRLNRWKEYKREDEKTRMDIY